MSEPTPDWHDAPTCAGLWAYFMRREGDIVASGALMVRAVSDQPWQYDQDLLNRKWRYFGPIPPDPEASK